MSGVQSGEAEGIIVCCTACRAWLEEISEASCKRVRYQEMAAEGLIDFEDLRTQPSKSYGPRSVAQSTLAKLERDRDSLLESYADLMPEAIDALGSEERHRAYRIIGLEVYLAPNGSFELSRDVMGFSKLEVSSA
jgi:hypothetical protein